MCGASQNYGARLAAKARLAAAIAATVQQGQDINVQMNASPLTGPFRDNERVRRAEVAARELAVRQNITELAILSFFENRVTEDGRLNLETARFEIESLLEGLAGDQAAQDESDAAGAAVTDEDNAEVHAFLVAQQEEAFREILAGGNRLQ